MGEKKRKTRGGVLLICFLLLLLTVTGCGTEKSEERTSEADQKDRLQIGMSFDSFVIERWLRDRDQFELTAKELGAEMNVQVANGDVQQQISQIRYFIKKKMDVIVVIAVDGNALEDVVAEAQRDRKSVV